MQKPKDDVRKAEVEELLEFSITNEQFLEALEHAKRKQTYIFERDERTVVLQHWYLVKLTEEYVRSLVLSKFTLDLCRSLTDMEKEHQVNKNLGTPQDTHIITVSAL